MRKILLVSVICVLTVSAWATAAFADELVGESDSSVEVSEPSDATVESSGEVGEEVATPIETETPSDASEPSLAEEPAVAIEESGAVDGPLPTEPLDRPAIVKADSPLGQLAYLLNGDPRVATAPPYGFGFSPSGVHWGATDNDYFQITSFKITPMEAGENVAGAIVGIGGIF